jgi:hypothetical protein
MSKNWQLAHFANLLGWCKSKLKNYGDLGYSKEGCVPLQYAAFHLPSQLSCVF